ncbi:hypothetical protein [Paenibacillus sp. FSL R7-269]|uniref:hypothetical protein n=1 Tax=Paenibacillus sp. FSL R7-269 TaxID=1226755 RepID=UPI0012EBEF50|nr:hypothetical protein [Paenibacillus sp. FSL R7-269]
MNRKKHFLSLLLTLVLAFSSFGLLVAADPIEQTGTHFETLNPTSDILNNKENDLLPSQNFNVNEIKSCGASTWGNLGLTSFISQYSFNKVLSWGLSLTPAGIAAFGPQVTVSAVNGSVTTASGLTHFINGANIYAPHSQSSSYSFHGSISTYPSSLGGTARLESGDTVGINFKIDSARAGGLVSVSCLVP